MTAYNDYVSSLGKSAPAYGSLFASTSAPSFSLFKPTSYKGLFSGGSSVKTSTPAVQPAAPSSTSTTPTAVDKPPTAPPTPTPVTTPTSTSTYTPPPTPTPTPAPTPSPTSTATASASTDASDPKTAYLDSYRKFLSQYSDSLKPTDEITAARTNLNEIQNKEDQQGLDARKAYEDLIHTSGMTTGGANEAGSVSNRNNSYILANLGVAESGAARKLDALTGDAKARSEALKAGADASKPLQVGDSYLDPATGKIIYEKPQSINDKYGTGSIGEFNFAKANGYKGSFSDYQNEDANRKKAIAAAGVAGVSSNGAYTAGANPTVDSWANRIQSGAAKISDIPASQSSLRNAVTVALDQMGNSADGKPTTTELGKAALITAKGLMDRFDKGSGTSVVGGSRLFGGAIAGVTPGSDAANFKNDFEALKSQLSLEGVKYLKGQGQVSDAERALLAQAVTKLNLSQSDAEFKKTLQGVIDKLEGGNSSANNNSGVLTSPDGTQAVNTADLTPAELKEAQTAGWK